MDDVTRLIQVFKRKGWQMRQEAAAALITIGEPAVVSLIDALKEEIWRVRLEAVTALGRIGDARAVVPLIEALKDRHGTVRQEAVRALGQIGDPRTVIPLIGALSARSLKKDDNQFKTAAKALGEIRNSRHLPPLTLSEALKEMEVRQLAAEVLGTIALHDPAPELRAALPLLRLLLRSSESEQEKETYDSAIQRIEKATAALKDLPLPARQPLPSVEGLPLPAEPPLPTADSLPIPATVANANAAEPGAKSPADPPQ